MTAGGVADKAKKAKDILKDAVIGVIIIMFAFIIVNIVIGEVLKVAKSTEDNAVPTQVDNP